MEDALSHYAFVFRLGSPKRAYRLVDRSGGERVQRGPTSPGGADIEGQKSRYTYLLLVQTALLSSIWTASIELASSKNPKSSNDKRVALIKQVLAVNYHG